MNLSENKLLFTGRVPLYQRQIYSFGSSAPFPSGTAGSTAFGSGITSHSMGSSNYYYPNVPIHSTSNFLSAPSSTANLMSSSNPTSEFGWKCEMSLDIEKLHSATIKVYIIFICFEYFYLSV